MSKLIWSVIPACICFGPLFMVLAGGAYPPGHALFSHLVSMGGGVMLGLGLAAMFKIITRQQMMIEMLQGRCTECGYDLRATPDRCPECGRVPKLPS